MPIKIAGQEVPQTPHEDVLVLPRGEISIAIRARAIGDFDEFTKICPDPKAPGVLVKGGGFEPNTKDKTYVAMLDQHNVRRIGWMVIRSLQEIEWDKVDTDDPKTWELWQEDFRDSGFTTVECNLVLGLVLDVNALNEDKLKQARESFIQGQVQAESESASRNSEPESTPHGEPVSASE